MYVTLPLSYRKDKRVAIGPLGKEEMVPIGVLGERARQALVSRQTKQVFLRMDAGVNAQEFLNVMDTLKAGGVEAIGHRARLDAPGAVRDAMEAIVSDILQSRKREPDGLKKTAAISLGAHAAAVALILVSRV